MDEEIRSFRIEIPKVVLEDLRNRLGQTRWPDEVNDESWSYGTDLS